MVQTEQTRSENPVDLQGHWPVTESQTDEVDPTPQPQAILNTYILCI